MSVPVEGGALTVGVWEGDGPVVLAAHGVTANHMSFGPLARALEGAVTLVAPDLRGRGGSSGLPGPFGMVSHARDLAAVANHFAVERPVVVGHSMGAYATAAMAAAFPDRLSRGVLVDGGLPLPMPEGVPVEELIQAVIGPAIARLSMTFESGDAYRDFWKAHPAVGPWWSEDIEAYVDYDLTGAEPELRPNVSKDAVIADSESNLTDPAVGTALERAGVPLVLLRAERGFVDDPKPLLPSRLVEAALATAPTLTDLGVVPDTNHYTIALAAHGAAAVAEAVRKAAAAGPVSPSGSTRPATT
jgi:pimeloyl-ACP methyl ester carboxylesterase